MTVPEPNDAPRPPGPPPPDRPGAAGGDQGRVLLLHGWDPHRPDEPFWFTIGGAADPGESMRDAGARELYEETRISVEPERLGEPIAQNSIEFSWGGHRIAQDQTFYAVAVGSVAVSLEGLDLGSGPPPTSTAGSRPRISKAMSAPPTRHPRPDPRRGSQRPPGVVMAPGE